MRLLAVIVIVGIIVGSILFIYFNYNTSSLKGDFINVSISAEYNKDKIITGLEVNGIPINTSQYYEIMQVPKGIVTIKNKNIDEQNYYENDYVYNITDNSRIDIPLDKPVIPEIKITHLSPLVVTLTSSNFKGAGFCLFSSVNYIFVSANYTEIDKPDDYRNADSCYNIGNLTSSLPIEISYTPLANPTSDDFLNITVYDMAKNENSSRLV